MEITRISHEFLLYAKGDEKNRILNRILYEINQHDSKFNERWTQGIIDTGWDYMIMDSLPIIYNQLPYTKRTYLIT